MISIVVPVLNAERWLPALFDALASQLPSRPYEVVLVVDSGSTDNTIELAGSRPEARTVPLSRFTHGGSRNTGVRAARGDVVVFLSQDACPREDNWLDELVTPLEDKQIAGVYSRQVSRDDATPMERFFLEYRFPDTGPQHRRREGPGPLTYEQVFFSDVSSAMRKSILEKFPFDETLLMGEDQQFARDVLEAGYTILYQPSSVVVHSHRYGLRATFRRYFDSVYAFRQILARHTVGDSAVMGAGYVAKELGYLAGRYPHWLPYYALYNLAKAAGTLAAHVADALPSRVAAACSLNPGFWLGSHNARGRRIEYEHR